MVGTKDPSSSTTFTATYSIPSSLAGATKIAIRFDSAYGYYAYDWFQNSTESPSATATAAQPHGGRHPKARYHKDSPFHQRGVQQGLNVSVLTKNFPAVRPLPCAWVNTAPWALEAQSWPLDSGAGGALTADLPHPGRIGAREQIAIRMDRTWAITVTTVRNSITAPSLQLRQHGTSTPTAMHGHPTAAQPLTNCHPFADKTKHPLPRSCPVTHHITAFRLHDLFVVKDQSVTISAVNSAQQTFVFVWLHLALSIAARKLTLTNQSWAALRPLIHFRRPAGSCSLPYPREQRRYNTLQLVHNN